MALTAPSGLVYDDKVKQDIQNHMERGYRVPVIADVYLEHLSES